jgi:hypothetical protein
VSAAFLWVALAAVLLLVAVLAALVSPAAVVYAALGVTAMGHAAILFTQAPSRRLLVGSTLVGLLSTVTGLAAASQSGLIPVGLVLIYAALSALATIASGTAARMARGRPATPPHLAE